MRTQINTLIEHKSFVIFIQVLIILSIVSFSLSTLPDLEEDHRVYLRYFEIFSITIFSIEYILRIISSKKTFNYIFSFFGLIDLLSILPFYLSLGIDLRALRGLRLLRLFRLFKLVRYNAAIRRFWTALMIAKEEFVLFFALTAIMLFLSATGIYYFENEVQPENFASVFDGLWWAVATLTTVGYGDIYPITIGGKIFTFIILLIGLGIVAVPAGLISSAMAKARELEKTEE